eukprot:TRINITY_DN577_c0_g1_i24.p1 TRINITY_DN577_c0_g1~~TRINITY_DN577_c0_g1_i24.p1  ORF type:complete len:105 (-),score=15.60 TRINITY_DN577_c0_g1_i24:23-337(-)
MSSPMVILIRWVFTPIASFTALPIIETSVMVAPSPLEPFLISRMWLTLTTNEQWPDFGCEGIKVQRAHQPTSQCQGKKKKKKKDRKSTRLNSSHITRSRMPSSA